MSGAWTAFYGPPSQKSSGVCAIAMKIMNSYHSVPLSNLRMICAILDSLTPGSVAKAEVLHFFFVRDWVLAYQ
jgi:hypothetical protein